MAEQAAADYGVVVFRPGPRPDDELTSNVIVKEFVRLSPTIAILAAGDPPSENGPLVVKESWSGPVSLFTNVERHLSEGDRRVQEVSRLVASGASVLLTLRMDELEYALRESSGTIELINVIGNPWAGRIGRAKSYIRKCSKVGGEVVVYLTRHNGLRIYGGEAACRRVSAIVAGRWLHGQDLSFFGWELGDIPESLLSPYIDRHEDIGEAAMNAYVGLGMYPSWCKNKYGVG